MDEGEKNKDEDVTLKVEFYETGATTAVGIAEMRDKYLRRSIAKKRGLHPDASWDEINSGESENARKMAAVKLNLDINSDWKKIVTEFRKQFKVIPIGHTPLIL